MTREQFFNKLVESDGGNSPPNQSTEIDVDKLVDTISLRLENKLKQELDKIQETNNKILNEKGEQNNEYYQDKQGTNKEGTLQSDNESESNTN